MVGRIKSVQVGKGFGFITCEDGVDRFFHRSVLLGGVELADTLLGLFVTFSPVVHALKGPRAIDVAILAVAPSPDIVAILTPPPSGPRADF